MAAKKHACTSGRIRLRSGVWGRSIAPRTTTHFRTFVGRTHRRVAADLALNVLEPFRLLGIEFGTDFSPDLPKLVLNLRTDATHDFPRALLALLQDASDAVVLFAAEVQLVVHPIQEFATGEPRGGHHLLWRTRKLRQRPRTFRTL